jgi:periplasmic protein TonB
MRRAGVLSLALHALLVLVLVASTLLWPPKVMKGPPVLAEVELVEQDTPTVGAASAHPASSPAPKQPAAASPAPAQPQPERQALQARLPLPPAAQPAPAAHAAPAPAAARLPERSAVGTGVVSGSQVIPAALDKAIRNVPPAYPPEAVRRGEQGSVILDVQVAADGAAAAVDVWESSGYPVLDSAARRAVASWHFIPARRAGLPVPSTMPVKIRFMLNNPDSSP